MVKDVIYSAEREVKTYAELSHGADVLIMKSEETKDGSYYTIMGALLLTAFTFEAYLNHLGQNKFKFWEEIESIRVLEKYNVLCTEFGLVPDYSKRPYQTLKELLKFRNAIAHGKSRIIKETKKVDLQDSVSSRIPKDRWEEYCTLPNAKRAKDDIDKIIKELHKLSGQGEYPFIHGITIGSLTPKSSKTTTLKRQR